MAVIVVITVIFLFIPLAKQDETQQPMAIVLNTIQRLVGFYKEEYHNLNIDGLYGLRALEGHTAAVIQEYEAGNLRHLSEQTVETLKALRSQVSAICEQALTYVRKDDIKYFEKLKYVISEPWAIFERRRRRVDVSLEWSPAVYKKAKEKINLDERKSDRCMSELIGSHKPGGVPCDISSQCVFIMTTPGLLGYGITHQLLWTMLAEKAGCKERLELKLTEKQIGGLSAMRMEFCSNNYIQLINTLKKFPNMVILPTFQDLFLEQMFICPSLGFYEFLDTRLLQQIVSWQHKRGCYSTMKRPTTTDGVDLTDILDESNYDYDENIEELNMLDNKPKGINLTDVIGNIKLGHPDGLNRTGRNLLAVVKGRKLLVEKTMTGGCLAHKTGVAAGALVIFLRYLCEPDAASIFNRSSGLMPLTDHANIRNQTKSSIENNDLKFQKNPEPFSNDVQYGLIGNDQQEKMVKPYEIKPDSLGGATKTNYNQNLLNSNQRNIPHSDKQQLVMNQPTSIVHNRVLRQSDLKEMEDRVHDLDTKQGKNDLKESLDPDKASMNRTNVDLPYQIEKPNQNHVKGRDVFKPQNVQKPVELNMPDDENDDDDNDEDYDGNDEYDDEDNDDYDGENEDDENENYDDYDKDKKPVPVQNDHDYVDNEEEEDDEYDQEDYDDENGNDNDQGDEDYDKEPKSIKENKLQKSPYDTANKDVLKGHINSRNIVNRNDFQADHNYGDNKRYDDKVKHGKNVHDRYAYDDYNRDNGDDDEDENGDDYDYDDKNEHNEVKDSNADIKLESVIHSKGTEEGALRNNLNISRDNTVSTNSALFVFALCSVSVVLLAYRFIKKRRIHFRFHPRVSHRV